MSISRDVHLRNTIRESVLHEARFLSSIRMAQNREELETNIFNITKKKSDEMSKLDNIYPSISENEIKDYMNEIMEEILKSKQKSEK